MEKNAKPWLNYTSDAPEKEYPQIPKKKRSFGWAIFWLLAGGHCGAHRLYLWEPNKAGKIFLLYLGLFVVLLFISMLFLGDTTSAAKYEMGVWILNLLSYLIIVVFEGMKLRSHVNAANRKYLLG